jgi:CheY-like chemotaxis protein
LVDACKLKFTSPAGQKTVTELRAAVAFSLGVSNNSAPASKPGPDVILLDVQMGDRNGLDTVRPIKSLSRKDGWTGALPRPWRIEDSGAFC